jgi:hypothetical protein
LDILLLIVMNVGYFNDTATVTNWAISKNRMI